MKKPKPLPAWRVTLIRKRGHSLGDIRAAGAEEAIQQAIKIFGIKDPHLQRRLVAQPIEQP